MGNSATPVRPKDAHCFNGRGGDGGTGCFVTEGMGVGRVSRGGHKDASLWETCSGRIALISEEVSDCATASKAFGSAIAELVAVCWRQVLAGEIVIGSVEPYRGMLLGDF